MHETTALSNPPLPAPAFVLKLLPLPENAGSPQTARPHTKATKTDSFTPGKKPPKTTGEKS